MQNTSIVLVATTDLATDQRLQRITASLDGAGAQVMLVGRVLPGSPPLPALLAGMATRLGCKYHRGLGFYAEYNLRICWYLLAGPGTQYKIICANDADTLLGCWLAAALTRRPLVLDAHEYFSQVPEVVGRPGVQRVWAWIEARLIPKTQARYTVSPALAALFSTKYGVPFATIRNVPRRADFVHVTIPMPIPGLIVYSGAANRGRGLAELIEAVSGLPVSVRICGDGDELEALQAKVQEAGQQTQITFTGRLSPEALREQIAQAWLGYSVLEDLGESYHYSLANKFFDYVQAGVPQLCPALPAYEQLLAIHPCALPTACLPGEIRAALLTLLLDNSLYTKLASACRPAAKEWCWEREEPLLVSIYKKLL